MNGHRQTLLIVATLNEVANLPGLLASLRALLPDLPILIVDDDSQDGTRQWLQAQHDPQLRWIIRTEDPGLGVATRAGLSYAIAHGFEWAATMDADGSHEPATLKTILDRIAADPGASADLWIGSRYVRGGRTVAWPLARRLGSRLVNGLSRYLVGLQVRDTTSAFRVYRVATLQAVNFEQLRCSGYNYLQEILWQLQRRGADIREFPIVFHDRQVGESKLNLAQAAGVIGGLLRLMWRRWFAGR